MQTILAMNLALGSLALVCILESSCIAEELLSDRRVALQTCSRLCSSNAKWDASAWGQVLNHISLGQAGTICFCISAVLCGDAGLSFAMERLQDN